MEQWFEALSLFEKFYWVVALISSSVFVVLIVMTLFGGDADGLGGDVDVEIKDDSGIGFPFLSFKNVMGFLTIFSWSGILAEKRKMVKMLPLTLVQGYTSWFLHYRICSIWLGCRCQSI
ncbi:hypothetical protein [Maribacter antarcticus]|uniref:hypothetical protein n=1 Tax=Maribacter antarcticus TaxID=505250 RepID=UPI000686B0E7|nr:hypothetical protein [Maribacter antarcticus]